MERYYPPPGVFGVECETALQVKALGSLEVSVNGWPVDTGPPQMRLVLAVLVARRREVVSTDDLATEIWGCADVNGARNLVQGYVSRIRRELRKRMGDPIPIATRQPGYILHLTENQLDIDAAHKLVTHARIQRKAGDLRTALKRFQEAGALWRGEPFADIAHGPIVRAEALELDQFWGAAREEYFDACLCAGEGGVILGELTRYVLQHPLRERAACQLMTALAMTGRRAEALKVYRRLRTRLVEELGMDPGSEIERVHTGILRGELITP